MHNIRSYVRPLYLSKDRMHDFSHILRIQRKVRMLRKDYKNIDGTKLQFLIYFHGLKSYVKQNERELQELGIPKSYFAALYRHTARPVTIEEKLVSDANLLEAVGHFGFRRSLQAGRERGQDLSTTYAIMRSNISKAKFYTAEGKRRGNPGISLFKRLLTEARGISCSR